MAGPLALAASPAVPLPVTIDTGWQLQDAAKVPEDGCGDCNGEVQAAELVCRYGAGDGADESGQ